MLEIGKYYLCKKSLNYYDMTLFTVGKYYRLIRINAKHIYNGEYEKQIVIFDTDNNTEQSIFNMNKFDNLYFFNYFCDELEERKIKLNKINNINH